jgi:hypothetical protein
MGIMNVKGKLGIPDTEADTEVGGSLNSCQDKRWRFVHA